MTLNYKLYFSKNVYKKIMLIVEVIALLLEIYYFKQPLVRVLNFFYIHLQMNYFLQRRKKQCLSVGKT